MALYLDSSETEDARQAMALGFIAGITTNPIVNRATKLRGEVASGGKGGVTSVALSTDLSLLNVANGA